MLKWLNCSSGDSVAASPDLYKSKTEASLANRLQESNLTVQQSRKAFITSYILFRPSSSSDGMDYSQPFADRALHKPSAVV